LPALPRPVHRDGAARIDPQCAAPCRGDEPPHHRPDATRRRLRLPAPGASRKGSGRGHVVPVEPDHGRRRPCDRKPVRLDHRDQCGTGARPTKDGLSATAYPSGVRGSPIEVVEATTPLVFWKKQFRTGSGGAGRYRGGHGSRIEIENRSNRPLILQAAFDRRPLSCARGATADMTASAARYRSDRRAQSSRAKARRRFRPAIGSSC